MTLRVKQFKEFVKRFNYEKDFFNQPIDDKFKNQFSRKEYTELLFNKKDTRIIKKDSSYIFLMNRFIDTIVSENLKISKHLENTYALSNCNIVYKGKINKINLLIKQIRTANGGYKWSILGVNATFLQIEDDKNKTAFIPPNNNELNFIALSKEFKAKKNISDITQNALDNQLHTFLFLIQNNYIQFKHVNTIKYFIFDIDNYVLTVEDFNRGSQNSGWLISNLEYTNMNTNQYFSKNYQITF